MNQNQLLADAALKIAVENLGQKEATGHNDGDFVNMVQEFVGGKAEHGSPWCACFRSWCMHQTGMDVITPKSNSSTFLFAYGELHGLILAHPIAGCTGLVRGSDGNPSKTHCHTFAVISVDTEAGVVHSIDGNEGNAVEETTHLIADCDFMACV